jgi:flagellar protein FliO/FliZ
MPIRLFILAALYCPFYAIAAAETARPAYTPPPPTAMTSGSVMQVIFSLILVLGLVALVAWLMKRINMPQHGAASLLKVISGVAVGPRERVVLVEVNDTWLIVGVAPGQVRTLHTLPKGKISEQQHAFGNADGKFQMWLKQMVEKRNAG